MVILGNLNGETISCSETEEHTNLDLNPVNSYRVFKGLLHIDPDPTRPQLPVKVFKFNHETLIVDPRIRFITGDYILRSMGYILGQSAIIKEDFLFNLAEFKEYISNPAALNDSGLDEIDANAVRSQMPFLIRGKSTELSRQVIREVTAGMNPCLEDGYRNAIDLNPWKIAVKIVRDNILRFKLIVMEVKPGSVSLEAYRRRYWKFIEFILLKDQNNEMIAKSPAMQDLHIVLTSRDCILPLDARYDPKDWTLQITLQRDKFHFKATTLLDHGALWEALWKVRFVDDLSEINYEVDASENTVGREYTNALNRIDIGNGNWLDEIRAHSSAVADLNVDGDEAENYKAFDYRQQRQPVCLVRFIRNRYAHFRKVGELARRALGNSVEEFMGFFERVFPHLIIQAYRILQVFYSDLLRANKHCLRLRAARDYVIHR